MIEENQRDDEMPATLERVWRAIWEAKTSA